MLHQSSVHFKFKLWLFNLALHRNWFRFMNQSINVPLVYHRISSHAILCVEKQEVIPNAGPRLQWYLHYQMDPEVNMTGVDSSTLLLNSSTGTHTQPYSKYYQVQVLKLMVVLNLPPRHLVVMLAHHSLYLSSCNLTDWYGMSSPSSLEINITALRPLIFELTERNEINACVVNK